MQNPTIYDVAGIGIGPFNLGLAALCHPIGELNTVFIEQKPAFSWHEGMMIPGTTLQVSWLADVVTLADPTSRFSYLSYLRENDRLIQFGIYEPSQLTRQEYVRYCRWVCSKLDNLFFGRKVEHIVYNDEEDLFEIHTVNSEGSARHFLAKRIVLGVGSVPFIPEQVRSILHENVIHSSRYLHEKARIIQSRQIIVVGSGQSGAEIFFDLLGEKTEPSDHLSWITQSNRFASMEHSKLGFEFTSPDYIDFFYALEPAEKQQLLQSQDLLFKGTNQSLLNEIYDRLYYRSQEHKLENILLQTSMRLYKTEQRPDGKLEASFYHRYFHEPLQQTADVIILATGYKQQVPDFLHALRDLIQFDEAGKYCVRRNYSIDQHNKVFVQNAELHTHGFNAPDLGLGPYRNAVIINTILGYEHYPIDKQITFQNFGLARSFD